MGIAVSGGADSVALLRLMLELRDELGIVVSVVHLNHKLRSADSDADEQFVRELAARLEAHAALEPAPVQAAPVAGEPYCALCQRDRDTLRAIRGILVKSEIPAGYVCSVCLAELS